MLITHQYALNAFRQVQAFLAENADKVGTLVESEGKQLLDDSIAQLEAHGQEQSSSGLEIDGYSSRKKALELDLKKEHMEPIASFARARLQGVPDYASLTRGTSEVQGHALVRVARAMATAAAPHTDAFGRGGFPADFLAQLGEAATRLEEAIHGRANLKIRRAVATRGIDEQRKRGHEAVRMLGAVIDRQFRKDKTFLTGWRSAKRVVSKPGVPRGTGMGYVPTTAPTPTAGAND